METLYILYKHWTYSVLLIISAKIKLQLHKKLFNGLLSIHNWDYLSQKFISFYILGESHKNLWKSWIWWRVPDSPLKSQILTSFGKKLQKISCKIFHRKTYFA